MNVRELITRLTEIEQEGFGDFRGIDDNGNDVMEAVRPVSMDGDVGTDPDAAAVMLHCYVDYRRGPEPTPKCQEPTCPDFGDPDFGEATCPAEHADLRPSGGE